RLIPHKDWEIQYRKPIFYLPKELSGEHFFYIRFESESSLKINTNIISSVDFTLEVNSDNYLLGLFYGLLLGILIYNSFLFCSTRDITYLYYVLFGFFFLLWTLVHDGTSSQYLWPSTSWWNKHSGLTTGILLAALALIFMRSILRTKTYTPKLDKFIISLIVSHLLLLALLPFSYKWILVLGVYFFVIIELTSIIASILVIKKGYRPAYYYLFSRLSFTIGVSIGFLENFAVLPPYTIFLYNRHISGFLNVLLLSFALADRYNILKQEKELAQTEAIDNLKKADQLKDEFLANTSHELKTPLNGIIGISESILDGVSGPVNEKQILLMNMVINSGKRLYNLVNDILDFSQLKQQDIILKRMSLPLKHLVDQVIQLSKPLVMSKSIRINCDVSNELPDIYADGDRIQQILHNLLNNAIKFTEEGFIHISAVQKNEMVEINLTDTGIGIAEEELNKIFNAFYQASSSIARIYGGTGLGLAISKKLIELHGGEIKAQSVLGEGSQFTFTIPVSTSSARSSYEWTESEVSAVLLVEEDSMNIDSLVQPNNGKRGKILAVDDDPINLQVIVNFLSSEGFTVVQALDGPTALEAFQKDDFDMLLLDVMMPRMTGYEVCEKIRLTHSKIELPIILLTAKNQIADLIKGMGHGANDFLPKPFSKGELLARMKTHLSNSQYYKELKGVNYHLNKVMKEMTRLTGKIHNSLKNKLESARSRLNTYLDNPTEVSDLKVIHNLLSHCSNESSNILFIIYNQKCSANKLLHELKMRGEMLFPAYDMEYEIQPENLDDHPFLSIEKVHGFLDIFLELLNNIIKHSKAQKVWVKVDIKGQDMIINLRDNGIGFDYSKSKDKPNSYGLKIIGELAQQIDGIYHYQSTIGEGTNFNLTIHNLLQADPDEIREI
ncbi:MAG TPA: response regulator, partial [Spirochaetes bacterium]|nr:response regulator [Spirochaetota bacterium]